MQIGGKLIRNDAFDPYIIAEIGVNFYDIARKEGVTPIEGAKMMISAAAESGADAAKFQSYKSEKIAARQSPAYWDTTKEPTTSQFELFKKFDSFGEEEYRELARFAESIGTTFLSTPFDLEAVEFLDPLVPVFKIASADIANVPLLERVASKGKPIILSVGAANLADVRLAVTTLLGVQPEAEIALLQCVLNYPTEPKNAHLGVIRGLRREFPDYPIGYSDHIPPSEDMLEIAMAVLLGSCIIEKHFTLDKTLPGNDHFHAMDPSDLRKIRQQCERIRTLYGSEEKVVLESEAPALKFARRSIVLARDVRAGEVLTTDHLIMKRPATGIPPTDLGRVIGMRAARALPEDQILQWEHLEPAP